MYKISTFYESNYLLLTMTPLLFCNASDEHWTKTWERDEYIWNRGIASGVTAEEAK